MSSTIKFSDVPKTERTDQLEADCVSAIVRLGDALRHFVESLPLILTINDEFQVNRARENLPRMKTEYETTIQLARNLGLVLPTDIYVVPERTALDVIQPTDGDHHA